ncbi:MAG: hypothetical protein KBA61_00665 [Spirochaetes bacterium]|nr:hypothetical protein [Spirochaetota bacterium]
MNSYTRIFNSNPLLKHCTERERDAISTQGRISRVKRGQTIDLKKISALNTILEGIFELEVFGKNEFIYLTPGSFFGDFPFSEIRNRGTLKAISDGLLLSFNTDDLYKFFFMNYKAFRGYMKALKNLGFEISQAGKQLFSSSRRIITVFSTEGGSGNTLFAASLAAALADSGNSILLDMSYEGSSVFNYLGRKITPPLSQKQVESVTTDQLISDGLEKITETLSLLNVLHGAKVKASPSIFSPLLLALTKRFENIVIDLSGTDEEFRDRIFEQSDCIIGLLKKAKNRTALSSLFDDKITGGQRAYHVLNYYHGDSQFFEGGYTWNKIDFMPENGFEGNEDRMKNSIPVAIMNEISAQKKAIVLQSGRYDSIAYAGLYLELMKAGVHYDVHHATSFGFLPLALFLNAENPDEYRKSITAFYSKEKMNNLLDITFPRESLFKNGKIIKMASDVFGNSRAEYFSIQPLLLSSRMDHTGRLFSTGSLADLVTSAMTTYPWFEPHRIGSESYVSGYPHFHCGIEELYRMDIDQAILVSIKPSGAIYGGNELLPFYANFLMDSDNMHSSDAANVTPATRLELEFPENTHEIEKIIEISSKATNKFLKENRLI